MFLIIKDDATNCVLFVIMLFTTFQIRVTSQQSSEADTVILLLEMRNLTLRYVKCPAQGHIAKIWQTWDSDPWILEARNHYPILLLHLDRQ